MQDFSTLHEFMSFTKGLTYVLMGVMLVALGGVWAFLTSRDEDE
ncbi:sulfate respiration complex protein HmcD [Desulfovermiculus halophilus]|jgi:glucose dehydrogenase|nr:hypothetical protein [Desulfovermiculus halophilus]